MWGVSTKKLENIVIFCLQTLNFCPRAPPLSPQPFLQPLPISCLLPGPWAAFGTANRSNSEAFVAQARAWSALFLTLILQGSVITVGPSQPPGSPLSSIAPTQAPDPRTSYAPLCLSCRRLDQAPLQCPLEHATEFFLGHALLPPGSTRTSPSLLGALPFTTFSLT